MIQWTQKSKEELQSISEIANRAIGMGFRRSKFDLVMDIEAAHQTCPMKLDDLLKADDSNFVHDVAGIVRHLDRETGELLDCFRPRFAQ